VARRGSSHRPRGIFLNIPFDPKFKPLEKAAVFAITACGYEAHCASETSDSGTPRINRITPLIAKCRLSVHDFSRTDADPHPRFNMPFEFGLALGARYFGSPLHRRKKCLVLATELREYQKFISDISGQDIEAHHDDPDQVIRHIRNFLRGDVGRRSIPGAAQIVALYQKFNCELPRLSQQPQFKYDLSDLHFADYLQLVTAFLSQSGWKVV
jgi:hypothetical protein